MIVHGVTPILNVSKVPHRKGTKGRVGACASTVLASGLTDRA